MGVRQLEQEGWEWGQASHVPGQTLTQGRAAGARSRAAKEKLAFRPWPGREGPTARGLGER